LIASRANSPIALFEPQIPYEGSTRPDRLFLSSGLLAEPDSDRLATGEAASARDLARW